MNTQLYCPDEARKIDARSKGVNGIDYLEVLDSERPVGSPQQQTLLVYCLQPVAGMTANQVRIEGGIRIRPVQVVWAYPVQSIPPALLLASEKAYFATLAADTSVHVLVVRTNRWGDFSTYTLRLIKSPAEPDLPPGGFDALLSSVEFSFKVDCDSELDCQQPNNCPGPQTTSPPINYLAKDYATFRRLMLDRLSVLMPDWQERNPADLGVALVEILAYAADYLSDYQDAVGTEAYLGTARNRVSVRRHVRLLDYPMHDGTNARAWVVLTVAAGADGAVLNGPSLTAPGAMLLTRLQTSNTAIRPENVPVVDSSITVFETMHDLTLRVAHNKIRFHTWGDPRCCLPKGATRATLNNEGGLLDLAAGHVLVFEESLGPQTGRAADADRTHRHAVRLTEATPRTDPLSKEQANPGQDLRVLDIAWATEDALPFPLCVWELDDPDHPGQKLPVSVAWGNVVLADHGRTIGDEALPIPEKIYRPALQFGPLTQQGRQQDITGRVVLDAQDRPILFDPQGPAAGAMHWENRHVLPAIWLRSTDDLETIWRPQRDLLNSDRMAPEFVVETEDDGQAFLRFGDGITGRLPVTNLRANYRIGNGPSGNVGPEAISHVVTLIPDIKSVRNPMAATGGLAPEPMDRAVLLAPQAFHTQERAVTVDDYAVAAMRHPLVQRAAATRRWTGSWYTMFVTVDRRDSVEIDASFRDELISFLERFRLAGYDLEVESPVFVALDIALTVCVLPGYIRAHVLQALIDTFSNRSLPDGQRGFFHPDNWTFAQPVYLSQLLTAAMNITGVASVKATTFQRWGRDPQGELDAGQIDLQRLEIARLDNDPNALENGRIKFDVGGGL